MKNMPSLLVAAALLVALPALAQTPSAAGAAATFPSKQIKIIVPFNSGSGADSSSRFYGEQLGKFFGQQVLVENKPGASGVIAVQATRQAPADGYTLLMGSNSSVANVAVMAAMSAYSSRTWALRA